MGKRMYEDLCEMLEGELNTLTKKGEITKESLELIDKLTHAIKSISTIKAMEEAKEWEKGGSYGQGSSYGRYNPRMSRNSSYDDGYSRAYYNDGDMSHDGSYAGRRGRDGDGDGRYSEEYRGYSRHDEKEAMMHKMQQMMNEAVDPKEKQMIQKYMQKMQSM